MPPEATPIDWLLDSDPALRWQTMRDLTPASPHQIASTRAQVAREGIGAQILRLQQPDGSWRKDDAPAWITTLFTMQLLRATGIDPTDPAVQSAMSRLEQNLRWSEQHDGWNLRPNQTTGNTFFQGEVEPCINGGALAAGAFLGHPNQPLLRRLLSEQLHDGGWNCEAPPSTCSSFHTTLCVLEGLLEYEHATTPSTQISAQTTPQTAPQLTAQITAARKRAEDYLLKRSLFRRLSTGQVIDPKFLELAFPSRYLYNILRALDYFRASNAPPDPRLAEAIAILKSKQQPDGRWLLEAAYNEAVPLPLDAPLNHPSRWNTLRALRVLHWYENTT